MISISFRFSPVSRRAFLFSISPSFFQKKDCAGCGDWHDACARRLGIEPDIFFAPPAPLIAAYRKMSGAKIYRNKSS